MILPSATYLNNWSFLTKFLSYFCFNISYIIIFLLVIFSVPILSLSE
ncbi:DUF2768 family protein [Clostridium sp. ASF356]|nr:DUF2768 family protein [Clostridium sp. MD294]